MEDKLYDAAFAGDTDALSDLLRENPNLLVQSFMKCEGDKTALHVSAMLGHEEFLRAILRLHANNPFCSSYHMCLARDRDGRNPLHLAAIHGRLNILNLMNEYDELIQAALARADRGGTVLHLCVEYDQFEALKLILEIFTMPEFVNANNEDGMTILHLAICHNHNKRRQQMIVYLINKTPDIINTTDINGKTAWDFLLEEAKVEPEKLRIVSGNYQKIWARRTLLESEVDKEIVDALVKTKAFTDKEIVTRLGTEYEEQRRKRQDAIMIVASVIATMAFQAMVSPPGGVWQDDSVQGPNPHEAGQSVMAKTHPRFYQHLILSNAVAFVSSLSIIVFLIRGMQSISAANFYLISTFVMWLSVAAISISYGISLVTITPESLRTNMNAAAEILIIGIMIWVPVIFADFYDLLRFPWSKLGITRKDPDTIP